MLSEPVLDAIAFHGTENSAACFRAIPEKTWFQGFLGRELTVIYGNSTLAVGPIETMVPGLPGQGVNGNIR